MIVVLFDVMNNMFFNMIFLCKKSLFLHMIRESMTKSKVLKNCVLYMIAHKILEIQLPFFRIHNIFSFYWNRWIQVVYNRYNYMCIYVLTINFIFRVSKFRIRLFKEFTCIDRYLLVRMFYYIRIIIAQLTAAKWTSN